MDLRTRQWLIKCDILKVLKFNIILLTSIARVKHACVTECDWLTKCGNYHWQLRKLKICKQHSTCTTRWTDCQCHSDKIL